MIKNGSLWQEIERSDVEMYERRERERERNRDIMDRGAATVTSLTLRRLMSYIYGAPILDVSRSHTTTQHSR